MSAPINTLRSIRDVSDHLLYSTTPQMMEARWAKDYYDGTYNKRQAEIDQALRDGKVPSNGGYNNEGGVSYIRIFDKCATISDCWKRLPQELENASGEEGLAQAFYDALDTALDKYWHLLRNLVDGLSQKDVAWWVGAPFRTLLNSHKDLFKVCGPKLLTTVKPLGDEKVEKVQSWIWGTETNYEKALKAAGA